MVKILRRLRLWLLPVEDHEHVWVKDYYSFGYYCVLSSCRETITEEDIINERTRTS